MRRHSMDEKRFIAWNEWMFRKYNNERLYRHPNPVIRYAEDRRVSEILQAIHGARRVLDAL